MNRSDFRIVPLMFALAACSATGEGTLETRIYGEGFIEDGIPVEVFSDGWSITFSRFLVALDEVGTDDGEDPGRYLFDLTKKTSGEGQAVAPVAVGSGEQRLQYRVAPGGTATGGNASQADRMLMLDGGYALFVEGTATNGAANIGFAWGLDTDTTYRECEVVESVPVDGSATTVITIHADHIFYDDLESTTPNVAFDLIAASDADADGVVTQAELLGRDLTTEARYQVGSQHIDNLWDYMSALSQTVGHIDGEGECKT